MEITIKGRTKEELLRAIADYEFVSDPLTKNGFEITFQGKIKDKSLRVNLKLDSDEVVKKLRADIDKNIGRISLYKKEENDVIYSVVVDKNETEEFEREINNLVYCHIKK